MESGLRSVTYVERRIIQWFAEQLSGASGDQLLNDLQDARVDVSKTTTTHIRFEIEGYAHPATSREYQVPFDAIVRDADGSVISVMLLWDVNNRLQELELVRYARGEVINPDWATLRALRDDEVINLGTRNVKVVRFPESNKNK